MVDAVSYHLPTLKCHGDRGKTMACRSLRVRGGGGGVKDDAPALQGIHELPRGVQTFAHQGRLLAYRYQGIFEEAGLILWGGWRRHHGCCSERTLPRSRCWKASEAAGVGGCARQSCKNKDNGLVRFVVEGCANRHGWIGLELKMTTRRAPKVQWCLPWDSPAVSAGGSVGIT